MIQKKSPAPVATGSEAKGKVFTDKPFTEPAAPAPAQFQPAKPALLLREVTDRAAVPAAAVRR
jgi:hypothetical protein